MIIGQQSNFVTPSVATFIGDGATDTFNLPRPVDSPTSVLVFLQGIHQSSGYAIVGEHQVKFDAAPTAGTKIAVLVAHGATTSFTPPTGVTPAIYELADGSVGSSKLVPSPVSSIGSVGTGLNADRVFYSVDASVISTFAINAATKQLLSSSSDSEVCTTLDLLCNTGDQTVTGTKTLSTRAIAPREPITWLSKSGHSVQLMVKGGKLYSTCSLPTAYNNGSTGRGISGTPLFFGADKFKEVPIPLTSPLVKAGLRGTGVTWALLEDGSLYTWGYNGSGACGVGHTNNVGVPTLSTTDVVEVYDTIGGSGEYESNTGARLFIKKTDGYIYSVGHNHNGQLGIGSSGGTNVVPTWQKLTYLGSNTVARIFNLGTQGGTVFLQMIDDSIWVAGYNGNGQLGLGNTLAEVTYFSDVTSNWGGGSGWVIQQMTMGSNYSYVTGIDYRGTVVMLLKNGSTTKVMTCGANVWGSCGDGTATQRTIPYEIPNSNDVKQISGSGGAPLTVHMLNNNGSLYGWGHNGQGQVGIGSTAQQNSPIAIIMSGVTDIFTDGISCWHYGYNVPIFIKRAGYLYAVGNNGSGECGLGHVTNPITTFTPVPVPYNAEVVEMGWFSSTDNSYILFARTADHQLFAWGYNGHNGVTMHNTINCLAPTNVTPRDKYL